jgi:plastocyanin
MKIKYAVVSAQLAFAAIASLAFGAVHAGSVAVIVLDAEGKPAPNVVVTARPVGKALSLAMPAGATATATMVNQEKLQFSPYVTVVTAGSSVKFVNKDAFAHHVKSFSPAKAFELRMDAAKDGKPNDSVAAVLFDKPGPVALQCHFHNSMRGHVYVSDTPYFGTTTANGAIVIEGVPEGEVELRAWHPDQFIDQATAKVTSGINTVNAQMKLNLTPRARRS